MISRVSNIPLLSLRVRISPRSSAMIQSHNIQLSGSKLCPPVLKPSHCSNTCHSGIQGDCMSHYHSEVASRNHHYVDSLSAQWLGMSFLFHTTSPLGTDRSHFDRPFVDQGS